MWWNLPNLVTLILVHLHCGTNSLSTTKKPNCHPFDSFQKGVQKSLTQNQPQMHNNGLDRYLGMLSALELCSTVGSMVASNTKGMQVEYNLLHFFDLNQNYPLRNWKQLKIGLWLWRSWQNGCLHHQQCDQIGRFFKVLGDKITLKSS